MTNMNMVGLMLLMLMPLSLYVYKDMYNNAADDDIKDENYKLMLLMMTRLHNDIVDNDCVDDDIVVVNDDPVQHFL